MKTKIKRPRLVEALARVPGVRRPVLGGYDAWLRLSYRRLWKWHNSEARRTFAATKPRLTEIQQRVLGELEARGIAHVPFSELIPDVGRWEMLRTAVDTWLASEQVQKQERLYRESGYKDAHFKEYLVRLHGRDDGGVLVPWNSPWLQLGVDSAILDIANYYLGMMSRLYHIDVWNTIALQHDGPLIGPQRWHRDPADVRLLKVFLYFTDVDASSGAMQYVPHSRPGERYGHLWPQDAPFDGARPPAGELARAVPLSACVSCSHPAGTLVFADTAGFHRGGRAETRHRVLATWAYSSQACRWPRAFRVDHATAPGDLSVAAMYALVM